MVTQENFCSFAGHVRCAWRCSTFYQRQIFSNIYAQFTVAPHNHGQGSDIQEFYALTPLGKLSQGTKTSIDMTAALVRLCQKEESLSCGNICKLANFVVMVMTRISTENYKQHLVTSNICASFKWQRVN